MIEISTPALLFPAVSLLLLAYTNRFLVIANLIRGLHQKYNDCPHEDILIQIEHLQTRFLLIKWMQLFGIASLLVCVLSMMSLFYEFKKLGESLFGGSLVLMTISLLIAFYEVWISNKAIKMELQDLKSKSSNRRKIKI